jgi:hypothetical protein
MSEAMAIEKMAENLAKTEGYFATSTNIPYLRKKDKNGNVKQGKQAGDLDVVGHNLENELLVIECKAYGGPEEYDNWFNNSRIKTIEELVDNAVNNIDKVLDPQWDLVFKKSSHTPHEVWIVLPGSFFPKRKAGLKRNVIVNSKLEEINKKYWKDGRSITTQAIEIELLDIAEKNLSEHYKVKVKLLPIHILLSELFSSISKDMYVRRTRYPDTSSEMIRWIVRTVKSGCLNLDDIQNNIKKLE